MKNDGFYNISHTQNHSSSALGSQTTRCMRRHTQDYINHCTHTSFVASIRPILHGSFKIMPSIASDLKFIDSKPARDATQRFYV